MFTPLMEQLADISTRVATLIEKLKLTSSAFADSIGMSRGTVSHITSGRNKPSLEFVLTTLAKYPEVSRDWLLDGKGEIMKEVTSSPQPSREELVGKQEAEELQQRRKEALKAHRQLNEVRKYTQTQEVGPDPTTKLLPASDTGAKIDRIIIWYSDNTFKIVEKRS